MQFYIEDIVLQACQGKYLHSSQHLSIIITCLYKASK